MSLILLQEYRDYIGDGTGVSDVNPRVQYIADYVESSVQAKRCSIMCRGADLTINTFRVKQRDSFALIVNPFIGGTLQSISLDGAIIGGWEINCGVIVFDKIMQPGTVEITALTDRSKIDSYFKTACLEAQQYMWRLGEKQEIDITNPEALSSKHLIQLDKIIGTLCAEQTKKVLI